MTLLAARMHPQPYKVMLEREVRLSRRFRWVIVNAQTGNKVQHGESEHRTMDAAFEDAQPALAMWLQRRR